MSLVSSTAYKYAEALADVAVEIGLSLEKAGEQLGFFVETFKGSEELKSVLLVPSYPLAVKQGILREISQVLKIEKIVLNFLLVLLEKGRIEQIEEVFAAYQGVLDNKAGVVRVDVASASKLGAEDQVRLAAVMKKVTGKDVKLSYSVDDDLIGGLKLQVGSTVYDGSILSSLEQLRNRMTAESN
ncbi:MAG: ATP synthase F1 subunit delta [Acidobacteriota bacterium]